MTKLRCPTCDSGDKKSLLYPCKVYGALNPWHFMPEPASSVPGAPDAEIDDMRFAAEKEVDLLVEQLAAKDRTIERLRADAQADDRDWTIIAQELGVEFVTREDIVKRVRAWRAELSQLKGEPK